jgi:uncharacterized protein (DUF2147 family)
MKQFILTINLLLLAGMVSAQSITGKWKTIDDETGKPKSIVQIFERNGKYYGKVEQLFREPSEDQDPVCKDCTDDRKDKRVIGMEVVRDMKKSGSEWKDGTICDPKNGKVYDCKMWLDSKNSDILNVRGYVLFFFRTQTWHRVK